MLTPSHAPLMHGRRAAASTSSAGLVDIHVATLAAHHNKKLWRVSWCCINDWRCYSVLHLPATDTDVDNIWVRFVRSFPQLAFPCTLRTWMSALQSVGRWFLSGGGFLRFLKTAHLLNIERQEEFEADLHELAVCHLYPYQRSHRIHP